MLTALLCDFASDTTLADLTPYCQNKKVSPRLSRPCSTVLTIPGDTAALSDTSYDGRPNLEVGRRLIKIYSDEAPGSGLVANTLIWTMGPSGDQTTTSIEITGFDPMILFPYRLVQEADGTFADPVFPSPISGAEILQLVLANTISNDGALPIDLSGAIASTLDLAADLTNWPMKISDLCSMLTDTGALDVLMIPVDTHSGAAAGVIGKMTAADKLGQDLTGTVSFDYGTGLNNVSNVRRMFDMGDLCNKLWYYLGPRIDATHYRGNITATEPGLAAYQALQLASRSLYGVYMDVKIFDDTDVESDARPMFHELWKNEASYRVTPRELLYMTPSAGDAGSSTPQPFRPWRDYNIGDSITANVSGFAGPAISGATQRIYGFDVEDSAADNVTRVSEFVVSVDGL